MKIKTLIKLFFLLFYTVITANDSMAQKRPKEQVIKWGISDSIDYMLRASNPTSVCPCSYSWDNGWSDTCHFEYTPSAPWTERDLPPGMGACCDASFEWDREPLPPLDCDTKEYCMFHGLGDRVDNINKPNIACPAGLNVNSYSGGLFYQRHDVYIPGKGLPVDLTFSYNNTTTALDFGYGYGWTMSYNMICKPEGANVIIRRGDGRKDVFVFNGIAYVPPVGVFDSLAQYQPGKFRLTTKFGINYYFDDFTHHRLTRINDPNNNEVFIGYSDSLATSIIDASGRSIHLAYNNGHLAEVFDPNTMPPRFIEITYDMDWNPVMIIGPTGDTISYYIIV